jgi:hypothetical protein
VTVYAITSLPFELARPACLADLLRGHWAIEAVHHIRDGSFAEDGSQVRTGAGPHVVACLRNLVIGMLSRAGPGNLAPRCATTPATPPGPWPPSASPHRAATHEQRSRENAGALGPLLTRARSG